MSRAAKKVVQYLSEAHASERALERVLESQIAMTPRGGYRTALEEHLGETRAHGARLERRLDELEAARGLVQGGVGFAQTVIGQALALGKAPLDALRGSSGEEKVLKNAKDAAATEALEIATYTALEALARAVGDKRTAELAADIRGEEVAMLERVLGEIPELTSAVALAEVEGRPSYDVSTTGAAEKLREGIVARHGSEPWSGYDELTVADVRKALDGADERRLREVRAYERAHKGRAGVLEATERELANA